MYFKVVWTMAFDTGLAGPQFCGPRDVSFCGQRPCTMKPTRRPAPHSRGSFLPCGWAQKSGA